MEMGKGKRRRTGKELVPCGGEGVMKKAEFPRTGRLPHGQAQGGAAESWKAGHFRAENRGSFTFSAHKELTDCGPNQMAGSGDGEKATQTSQHRGWAEGSRRVAAHKPL